VPVDVAAAEIQVPDPRVLAQPLVHGELRPSALVLAHVAVVEHVQHLVAGEHRGDAARVIEVRVRDDQERQRSIEVVPAREEAIEVGEQRRLAVELVVLLAAGVDQDGAAGELEQLGRALSHVDDVEPHDVDVAGRGARRPWRRRVGQVRVHGLAARGRRTLIARAAHAAGGEQGHERRGGRAYDAPRAAAAAHSRRRPGLQSTIVSTRVSRKRARRWKSLPGSM
jgi:hypothetical protein